MSTQVYTDPREPGAPRVGDVVVVVTDGAPGTSCECDIYWVGTMGVVQPTPEHQYTIRDMDHYWAVDSCDDYVHAVRRPTPEELAAHQLTQGTP